MALHLGIGPHKGRELELMLEGVKKCALFSDALPASGEIAEDIIPEKAFAPYVASGQFLRIARDFHIAGHNLRCVCFTHKDEAWRAEFLLWIKGRLYGGGKVDHADEVLEGRILGYSEDEIIPYLPPITPSL